MGRPDAFTAASERSPSGTAANAECSGSARSGRARRSSSSSRSPTPASLADGMPSPLGISTSPTRSSRAALVGREGVRLRLQAPKAARRPAQPSCCAGPDEPRGAETPRCSMRRSVVRNASAQIVLVGFIPLAVGKTLPSMTPRLRTRWVNPQRSQTDVAGSSPIRVVPMKWPLARARTTLMSAQPASASDSRARSACHASMSLGVVARAVADATPGQAGAVDDRRPRVTRLSSSGRSSASSTHCSAAADLLAHPLRGARCPSPRVWPRATCQRLPPAGQGPAGAAHEAAGGVGVVELQRIDEAAVVAVPRSGVRKRPLHQGHRMQHQSAADQSAIIGQPVRVHGCRRRRAAAAGCRCRWPRTAPRRPRARARPPSASTHSTPVARSARSTRIRRTIGSRDQRAAERARTAANASDPPRPWRPRRSRARRCRAARRRAVRRAVPRGSRWCRATSASPSVLCARATARPSGPIGNAGSGGSSPSG